LALHFSDYSFWVRHLVSWDDKHLLVHAIASDVSVNSARKKIVLFKQNLLECQPDPEVVQ
jgi:uncharacterized NAD(P)/FAD-binding protein YdhS